MGVLMARDLRVTQTLMGVLTEMSEARWLGPVQASGHCSDGTAIYSISVPSLDKRRR